MTQRTRYAMRCGCGNVGFILLRENDKPFETPHEEYTPDNLNARDFECESAHSWALVLAKMEPQCTDCGAKLDVTNLDLSYK